MCTSIHLPTCVHPSTYQPHPHQPPTHSYPDASNIAALVWRVEYNRDTGTVVPSRPVVTFGRHVTFRNKKPMELGLRYGWRFWEGMEENKE